MDFFARQRRVRQLSARLVALFAMAVIGIVLTVDLVVAVAFNAWQGPAAQLGALMLVVSVATLTAISLAALVRMAGLRGGGGKVARELGGVLVPPDTDDPRLRRLRNVVEEIAIASGVTVPEIYVLPQEPGINAFAAGWSTSDAAVAVTRGALERLNRDELQGVIAHEFSHVVNGDMKLNIRLMGLLFGILFLTVIGRMTLQVGVFSGGGRGRGDGGRSGGNNPLPLIGLGLVAAGFIGVVAGRLIKAAVSRQREYLADASAVQFTRQTTGIAGALKKIGGLPAGSAVANARTEEVGHMLFGPGIKLSTLFATHPPLVDRIHALDPTFQPGDLDRLAQRWAHEPPSGMQEDLAMGLAPTTRGTVPPLPEADIRTPMPAELVVAQVATSSGAARVRAAAIIDQIPEEFLDRARTPDTVIPLLFGLLMSPDPPIRQAQHAALAAGHADADPQHARALADAAWAEANALAGLHPVLRLPLAQLAFPALRQHSRHDQERVMAEVTALVEADNRITVFEYCLSRLLRGELRESTRARSSWRADRRRITANSSAVATLFAVLAQVGNDDPGQARTAYEAGAQRVLPGRAMPYAPPTSGVTALEPLWSTLDRLHPDDKSLLVQGAVEVISRDGVMTVTEIELLRTVCALLHCPLPLLAGPDN